MTNSKATSTPKANVLVYVWPLERDWRMKKKKRKKNDLQAFMQNSTLAGAGAGTIEILLMQVNARMLKVVHSH